MLDARLLGSLRVRAQKLKRRFTPRGGCGLRDSEPAAAAETNEFLYALFFECGAAISQEVAPIRDEIYRIHNASLQEVVFFWGVGKGFLQSGCYGSGILTGQLVTFVGRIGFRQSFFVIRFPAVPTRVS